MTYAAHLSQSKTADIYVEDLLPARQYTADYTTCVRGLSQA